MTDRRAARDAFVDALARSIARDMIVDEGCANYARALLSTPGGEAPPTEERAYVIGFDPTGVPKKDAIITKVRKQIEEGRIVYRPEARGEAPREEPPEDLVSAISWTVLELQACEESTVSLTPAEAGRIWRALDRSMEKHRSQIRDADPAGEVAPTKGAEPWQPHICSEGVCHICGKTSIDSTTYPPAAPAPTPTTPPSRNVGDMLVDLIGDLERDRPKDHGLTTRAIYDAWRAERTEHEARLAAALKEAEWGWRHSREPELSNFYHIVEILEGRGEGRPQERSSE